MRRGEAGFTLVEAIVALAIAVTSLAAFYRIYGLGWRGVRAAQTETQALGVARNRLALAGIAEPLAEGISSGETNGLSWTTEIKPYESETIDTPLSFEPAAWWVVVRVSWPGDRRGTMRSLELTTIKLARLP